MDIKGLVNVCDVEELRGKYVDLLNDMMKLSTQFNLEADQADKAQDMCDWRTPQWLLLSQEESIKQRCAYQIQALVDDQSKWLDSTL